LKEKVLISASIVLFNEDEKMLQKTIRSFLETPVSKKLFLIDNSPTNRLKKLANQTVEIEYIHTAKNLGFGRAHNIVLDKINSDFHLILNPDVIFKKEVLPNLGKELVKNPNVAMISPKVCYPNGDLQNTCRKNPTPKEMIGRRLGIFTKTVQERSYQDKNFTKPFYPQFIHGCFMLFKTADLKKIKGFDERYFLYLEDADICRKIKHQHKEILYFPDEQIIHIHRKGSAKKIKLLWYHLQSAFKYFRKWGFKP